MDHHQASPSPSPAPVAQGPAAKRKWIVVASAAFTLLILLGMTGYFVWQYNNSRLAIASEAVVSKDQVATDQVITDQAVEEQPDPASSASLLIKPDEQVEVKVEAKDEDVPLGFWGRLKHTQSPFTWNISRHLKSINTIIALGALAMVGLSIFLAVYFSSAQGGGSTGLLPPPPITPTATPTPTEAIKQTLAPKTVWELFTALPFYAWPVWILAGLAVAISVGLLLWQASTWFKDPSALRQGPGIAPLVAAVLAACAMVLGSWLSAEFSLALLAGASGEIKVWIWAAVLAFVWVVFLLIIRFKGHLPAKISEFKDTNKFWKLVGLLLLFTLLMGGFGTVGNVVGAVGSAMVGVALAVILIASGVKPDTSKNSSIGLFITAVVFLLSSVVVAYFGLFCGVLSFALASLGGGAFIFSTCMSEVFDDLVKSILRKLQCLRSAPSTESVETPKPPIVPPGTSSKAVTTV